MAVLSLPAFSGVGPWIDNARALGQMTEEVMSATQWAHAGPRSPSGWCSRA